MFLSLSASLPPPLSKIKKHVLGWGKSINQAHTNWHGLILLNLKSYALLSSNTAYSYTHFLKINTCDCFPSTAHLDAANRLYALVYSIWWRELEHPCISGSTEGPRANRLPTQGDNLISGHSEVIHGLSTVQKIGTPNPSRSRVNYILKFCPLSNLFSKFDCIFLLWELK